MWMNTIFLLALTSVSGTTVLSLPGISPETCCSEIKDAQEVVQQFKFTVTPSVQSCTCTVKTGTKRTIQVSIPLTEASTEPQPQQPKCLMASHGNDTQKICNQANQNKYTAKGEIKITQVSDSSSGRSSEQITIEYQLVNDEKCAPALEPATADEQLFFISTSTEENIPAGLNCIWRINTTNQQNILVQVKTDSSSTENQCVSVSDDDKPGKQICGKNNENKFVSRAKDVTIKYEDPSSKSTVKNFQVSYRFVNDEQCASALEPAKPDEQTFYISNPETENIPADLKCIWRVDTTDGKSVLVQVHADSSATDEQCVFVSDEDKRTDEKICTATGEREFESNDQSVTIRYDGGSKEVPNFRVSYKSSATSMQVSSVLISLVLYHFWKF